MEAALQYLMLMAMLGLGLAGMVLSRDPMHPAPLNAMVWSVVCAAYLLLPHGLRNLTQQTLLLILISVAGFAMGSAGATRAAVASSATSAAHAFYRPTVWRQALFVISVVGMPFFLLRAQALAASAPYTESEYINLRIALIGALDDVQTFGLLGYLIPVSFASTLVELAGSKRWLRNWRGWLSLALSLAYAVLSSGRTYILLLVTSLAFVAILQRRAKPAQIAALALGLFAAAFFGLGMLANKIGEDTPNVDALNAADSLYLYLLGGVAAMDVSLARDPALEWGINVFRTPLAILHALGADVPVVPLVKEYVNVPLPTNVYTVLQPYQADFGWPGVLIFSTLFGLLHGWLYQAARAVAADPRTVIFAALAVYPLLMQCFQDQYLSLLSTWVTFFLLVMPAFRRVPSAAAA